MKIEVNQVSRSGFKFWLDPNGNLYTVNEHGQDARLLAEMGVIPEAELRSININPDNIPVTFGTAHLWKLGWLRLVTTKELIMVTGEGDKPKPSTQQRKTLEALRDRYFHLNKVSPEVLYGDTLATAQKRIQVLDTGNVGRAVAANLDAKLTPSFYKRGGRDWGESKSVIARLMDMVERILR